MCGHGVCTCTCVPAFSVSFVAVSEQAMHTTRLIDCETVLTFKPLDDGVFITCRGWTRGVINVSLNVSDRVSYARGILSVLQGLALSIHRRPNGRKCPVSINFLDVIFTDF